MATFAPIGQFRVVYADGTNEVATSNFAGLIAVERKWPSENEAPGIEAIALAVWHYLGCPGEFDEWAERVHQIESAEDDDDEVAEVPTLPAAGAA